MNTLTDVGHLMYLYMEEIETNGSTDAPNFLINTAAQILVKNGGRNWLPVIVIETGEDRYQVIGNFFTYAVVEAAGLERVWCVIAENNQEAQEITQLLARETIPKINLSTASRDEIKSALEYLIKRPNSPLKDVNLLTATTRIDEAPRQYWTSFDPLTKLKCKITKGKRLNAMKELFYLTPLPQPKSEVIPTLVSETKPVSSNIESKKSLNKMTVAQLKNLAKQQGLKGYGSLRKAELVKKLELIKS